MSQFKILVIRLQTMNPTVLIQDLKQAGFHVLWPNLPGISHMRDKCSFIFSDESSEI